MPRKRKQKRYSGEKYVYLLMAYKLAELNNKEVVIGRDYGYPRGHLNVRSFNIIIYDGKTILQETKTMAGNVDYSRQFVIYNAGAPSPGIYDYMNEYGENCGQVWEH